MKKFVLGIILAVFSAIAFALPSPKMIEGALQNGNFNDARSMVQQVLEEKPDSARAHLLDAFILIHADHNRQAAAQELDAARRLDTKGDVSGSPLFGRVTAEIDMTKDAAPPVKRQAVQQTPVVQTQVIDSPVYQSPPKHESHAGTIILVILVLVILAILAYLFIRGATRRTVIEPVYVPPYRDVSNTTVVSSGSSSLGYSAPSRVAYNPAPAVVHQPVVVAPPPVIVGGYNNNGFVEGMMIGEMMENNARLARIEDEDRYERRRRDDSYSAPAVVPDDSWSRSSSSSESKPSPVSYASESKSYSSSRDDSDSWSSRDSSSSSSSSSDSWSSTSSDNSWSSGSDSSFSSSSDSGGW